MKRYITAIFLLMIVSAYGYYDLLEEHNLIIGLEKKPFYEENTPPKVYFNYKNNLTKEMYDLINNHDDVKCAFYDLDHPLIINILKEKNAQVTIENDNKLNEFHFGKSSAKMHNKFCIFDNKTIITGSTNPTLRGLEKNNNNLLVIHSEYVAMNYLNEFDELISEQYGSGNRVEHPIIILNNKTTIKNLFCPEDDCQKNILEELGKAKESIYFMTFSFTDKAIADKLIEKKMGGLDIQGVFEKARLNINYEKYKYLNKSNVTIYPDKNKYNMHHKVFIIDNETVITGSYNPTASGNEKNDENIIIIKDKQIANDYLEEFGRLR